MEADVRFCWLLWINYQVQPLWSVTVSLSLDVESVHRYSPVSTVWFIPHWYLHCFRLCVEFVLSVCVFFFFFFIIRKTWWIWFITWEGPSGKTSAPRLLISSPTQLMERNTGFVQSYIYIVNLICQSFCPVDVTLIPLCRRAGLKW